MENSPQVKQWQQQVTAYVAWVNSQLKRRPGTRLVEDLRRDMQDGVALSQLVECVAGEPLSGILPQPTTPQEKLQNVERVLQFMSEKRIRMHQATANDVVEGNLKSIMRLVLALAAHFKPSSVKHAAKVSPNLHRSVTSIAQGASARLAEARHQQMNFSDPRSPSSPAFDPDNSRRLPKPDLRDRIVDGSSDSSSRPLSCAMSPRERAISQERIPRSRSHNDMGSPVPCATSLEVAPGAAPRRLTDGLDDLLKETGEARNLILSLHSLLLTGVAPDGEPSPNEPPCEGSTAEEQIAILRGRLQQADEQCRDLRKEANGFKSEMLELQGVKSALQQSLSEREKSIVKVESDLLRLNFTVETLETDKKHLKRQLEEKTRQLLEAKKECSTHERHIETMRSQWSNRLKEREVNSTSLRTQASDLQDRLVALGENEVELTARLNAHERQLQKLETQMEVERNQKINVSREDLSALRNSFRTLRGLLNTASLSQRVAFEGVERTVLTMLEKTDSKKPEVPVRKGSLDSANETRRSPVAPTAVAREHVEKVETKVVYSFGREDEPPYLSAILKRIGDITLSDFKVMFNRPGKYRFHFKSLDPEFGTVKEERTRDDDVLPGWEGKIVAWVKDSE